MEGPEKGLFESLACHVSTNDKGSNIKVESKGKKGKTFSNSGRTGIACTTEIEQMIEDMFTTRIKCDLLELNSMVKRNQLATQ